MPEGVYIRDYKFICKKCGHTFIYHKLDKCPKCKSFGVRIDERKNRKKIKFIKEAHPTNYNYAKIIPIKTHLMKRYEKETGKRSIAKYLNKPSIHNPVGIEIEGEVLLSKGFLEWIKK